MKLFSVALSAVLVAAAAAADPDSFVVNINPDDPSIVACINLKDLFTKKGNFLTVGLDGDDLDLEVIIEAGYPLTLAPEDGGTGEVSNVQLVKNGKNKDHPKCSLSKDLDLPEVVCKYEMTEAFVDELEVALDGEDTKNVTLNLIIGNPNLMGSTTLQYEVCLKDSSD